MSLILFNIFFLFLDPGPLTAISAILINAETGQVLYEKNIHESRSPASVVKIATCAYALQQKGDELETFVETPQDCIGAVSESEKQKKNYSQPAHWLVHDASHMGLKKGEILSFKDLLYGMMVCSADDASNVIAHFVGNGLIPQFMNDLNAWISSLGCQNTLLMNPHGLYHPKQRTTAYDLALITQEAMKNPLFREIVRTPKYQRPKTNKQEPSLMVQTNQLIRKGKKWYYPFATGIKTGKIAHSGFGLVASAEKNDRSLIAVVLGCKESDDRFKETIQLFDAAFNEPRLEKVIFEAGSQTFEKEFPDIGLIKTTLNQPLKISYYASEDPVFKASLSWKEISPPLLKGEPVAMLTVVDSNQNVLGTAPLLVHSVEQKNFLFNFLDPSHGMTWQIVGAAIILLILVAFAWRFSR